MVVEALATPAFSITAYPQAFFLADNTTGNCAHGREGATMVTGDKKLS